jgi:hypothetical protein
MEADVGSPAIPHAPRSHAAIQALDEKKTLRPPTHQPPEDILAVMEPVVVLVWDSIARTIEIISEIHDLEIISRGPYLGEFRRKFHARDATEDR